MSAHIEEVTSDHSLTMRIMNPSANRRKIPLPMPPLKKFNLVLNARRARYYMVWVW